MRVRARCEFCDRRSRWREPDWRGRVDLFEVGHGWSVAPYSASFVHSDGTRGDKWSCPDHSGGKAIGLTPLHVECTETRDVSNPKKMPAHRLQPAAGAVPTPSKEQNMPIIADDAQPDESQPGADPFQVRLDTPELMAIFNDLTPEEREIVRRETSIYTQGYIDGLRAARTRNAG